MVGKALGLTFVTACFHYPIQNHVSQILAQERSELFEISLNFKIKQTHAHGKKYVGNKR
jgi:hypothetical protein